MTRRRLGILELAKLHADETVTWPERLHQALHQLTLTADPYHTTSGHGSSHGISDPTATAAINTPTPSRQARNDRRQLINAILTIDQHARTVTRLLNEYAPPQTQWCTNHRRYGYNEPRAPRSTNCRWCTDIHRRYGHPPTLTLIRRHDQGHHIPDHEYRQTLET